MKTTPITLLLIILAFWPTTVLQAQIAPYRHLLPAHLSIRAEAETEKFVWFGTEQGLFMVRKKNGKVYHMTTHNSVLPSDLITGIAVKPNGEAFIGTGKGIMRYDNYAFLLVDKENSALPSNDIREVYTDCHGHVIAETGQQGATIFSEGQSRYCGDWASEKNPCPQHRGKATAEAQN